jgi:hypothetical protein
MDQITIGERLVCTECGSEAIVVATGDAELTCCGKPLTPSE